MLFRSGEAGAKEPREEAQGMLSGVKPSKATGTGFGALAKEKNKRKIMESRHAPRAPGSDHSKDDGSVDSQSTRSEAEAEELGTGPTAKWAVRSVEEGRIYLEEEALIDPGERIDLDTMAGTLVQLSLMEGTPASVGLAVRAVALILVQMKMEAVSETLIKMMP